MNNLALSHRDHAHAHAQVSLQDLAASVSCGRFNPSHAGEGGPGRGITRFHSKKKKHPPSQFAALQQSVEELSQSMQALLQSAQEMLQNIQALLETSQAARRAEAGSSSKRRNRRRRAARRGAAPAICADFHGHDDREGGASLGLTKM